nr:RimK family alpha-L-glutamate ligase [Candidatus Njordarchaeota archaeon]
MSNHNGLKKIACFVETYNFLRKDEVDALRNFKQTAEMKGHTFNFIYKRDIHTIPQYDSLFIRATTDPTYTAYIVSKLGWENGLKVVDAPKSIQICANKISMYGLLEKHGVPYIPTVIITRDDLRSRNIQALFELFGSPLVLKAPYTSFSRYVEKVASESGFRTIAKRYFRRSDAIVVQRFMPTSFDWRVGVLDRKVLYVCKYAMIKGKWKHGAKLRGKQTFVWGETFHVKKENAPEKLKEVALNACNAIGEGLFGADIKEINGDYVIVEVNDNPSIYAGFEDYHDKDIYEKIIDYLVN